RRARAAYRRLSLRGRHAAASDDKTPAAGVSLDAAALAALAPGLRRRVVRLAVRDAGLGGRDLPRERIDALLALAAAGRTGSASSPPQAGTARLRWAAGSPRDSSTDGSASSRISLPDLMKIRAPRPASGP